MGLADGEPGEDADEGKLLEELLPDDGDIATEPPADVSSAGAPPSEESSDDASVVSSPEDPRGSQRVC